MKDKEIKSKLTLKRIFADIIVWFIMMYAFNKTYKEMRKDSYDLELAHRRMWGLIILGLFAFIFIVIITYIVGLLE